ncbi:glycosyltransferase family 39 protein [Cyanobacterium aponinum]|uniref:glycosyltransferase family 39 protein n=1 Tax=Cyanobacterium aponinum TaxID=379064 RepID=UPI000C12A4A7|nr:glycosyltransferase family 39 protein [Cyanobacterium aponinum]PHV62158.1 glycosyl transferase [Cyanobacterium aponinum IPPAS B-1201]
MALTTRVKLKGNKNSSLTRNQVIISLLLIWLFSFGCDRIWFSLDNTIPAWDPSEYLNGVTVYQDALRNPRWFDGAWWREFWLLSNKVPPLMYIITSPFFMILGGSVDHGNLVLSLFNLILLISLFLLGRLFFNDKIALFACILIQLIPSLYYYRLEFLLDFPLTVIIIFSFTCFSYWYFSHGKYSWWLSILSGISFGLGVLLKQTFAFFLFIPIIYSFFNLIFLRQWQKIAQLLISFICAIITFYPWYRTNWLLIFTSGKRATIDSAIIEGDPPLNTLKAWTFYGEILPYLLSWVVTLFALFGLVYLVVKYFSLKSSKYKNIWLFLASNFYQNQRHQKETIKVTIWLGVYLISGYLLSSLNMNKDIRYILPLIPVLALIISALIYSYQGKGKKIIKIVLVFISVILMIFNYFPLGGNWLTAKLSPKMQNFPYMGEPWATPEIIPTAIETTPYLRSNIGVLPSTPEINQHNISFYGSIPRFKVFGRQVGTNEKFIPQDINSMDWFLTKTGYQGSIPDSQTIIVNQVENNGQFTLVKNWSLPDDSQLKLYYKKLPNNEVKPLNTHNSKLNLVEINIPPIFKQGVKIPVSYQWSGSWDNLVKGILILDWQSVTNPQQKWTHDHALAMGNLHSLNIDNFDSSKDFLITENTAMFVPNNMPDGDYILKATYLDKKNGESYPLSLPKIVVTVAQNSPSITTDRELDLISQLRIFAPNLSQGIEGLDPVFAQVGRINQYDPTQDYLKVAQKAMEYRLQQEENINYLYTLLLAQVLQQNVKGAIASAQELVTINPDNAFNHAYLSFLYLYDWRGEEGEKALKPALELQPEVKEFQYLEGISALMQGNLLKAWQIYQNIVS